MPATTFDEILKYNHHHGADGRFASKDGAAAGGALGQFRGTVGDADDAKLIGMWESYKEDTSTAGMAMNSIIETELEDRGLIELNDDTFEYELTDKAPKKPQKAPAAPTNKDNTGRELSPQQAEYFKNSKARDENGNLYVLYHNTDVADIEEFRTQTPSGYGGLYTSTEENVAQNFGAKTYKMYANLENPLIIDANGDRYDAIDPRKAPAESNTFNSRTLETNQIAAYARDNGYDGLIVQNVMESSGYGTDVIAFYPEQLKAVDNGNPTASRNIHKSFTFEQILKYNHNHDNLGRFSSSNGGGGAATRGHIPHMKGQELVDYTMKELGVSEQEAKDMVREVSGYTDGYATDMRSWQQYGDRYILNEMSSKEARTMSEQVERFIDKSPKWDGGELYRGISVDDDTAIRILDDIYYSGKPFDMKGTSSWTSDKNIADDFSEMSGGDIAIIFKTPGTKKGTSIDHISNFSQSEVLVSKDARWNVKRIEGGIDDGYLVIEMEEIP